MKKIMTALLAVMAIMLTACGAPAESSPPRETPSPQPENLIMLTNHTPYFTMGEKGGYMTANSIEFGYDFYGELLFSVNEDDKTMQPLCNRTDCRHDTEECTAFLPGGQGGYSIVYHNGKIYCFVGGNSQGSDGHCAKIYSVDEKTLEKKLIKEFEYGYRIYTERPVFSAKDSLYYLAEFINSADRDLYYRGIVKFDTATGNTEFVYTTDMTVNEMGTDNGKLVFTAHMPAAQHPKMYYLDLRTGQAAENTNYDCRYEILWSTVNGIISYDETNSVFYRYTDGEKEKISALVGDKVGYTGMFQRGVYNSNLVLDCFKTAVLGPGDYSLISTKLAVDLAGGDVNEIQLKYSAGGLTEEVAIVGVMQNGFVVKCGEEYSQIMVTGQDGIARPQQRTTTRLAYITADDFFNSRQNYIYLN